MNIVPFFFYIFSGILVGSAFMVVSSRNPVHSVLFLILAFFNAAGLFLLLGAEFLAMILLIVYVGAVAVLFLFIVMMLDVDFVELRQGFVKYLPIASLISAIFFVELAIVLWAWKFAPKILKISSKLPSEVNNTLELGRILYTQDLYFFEISGLILLVAMIGAIVLTLRERVGVRRQDVMTQNARNKESAMFIVNVSHGAGVSDEGVSRADASREII